MTLSPGRRPILVGAGLGVLAWLACAFGGREAPQSLIFYLAACATTFGAGAPLLLAVESQLSRAERTVFAFALGTVFAPVLIWGLMWLGVLPYAMPAIFAAAGIMAARWSSSRVASPPSGRDWYGCIAVVALVFGIGLWMAAGRIDVGDQRVAIFGDYDTFDLTYYAVIASELTHTLPPASPFFAGHQVVYSYFPLLFLASVQRLTGVSMTYICVALAWPMFAAVASATVFLFCRRLAGGVFATLASLLMFTGSSLAYVAAMIWPNTARFDQVIWSSMFLAPSAEWLYFNAWAPALTVIFAGLYALDRAAEERRVSWTLFAALCFGLLFMFKSFAFVIVMPALGMTLLVRTARAIRARGWAGVWRTRSVTSLLTALALAVPVAAPWLWSILVLNGSEGRAAVTIEWLSLVRRMVFKMDITAWIASVAAHLVSSDPDGRAFLTIAIIVFLVGGLGTRLLGLVPVLRSVPGGAADRWSSLGWMTIIGVVFPFFVAVAPFPNSIQAYQLALFVMWLFTARVLWPANARPTVVRVVVAACFVIASAGSTIHYAATAHRADKGRALAALDADDLRLVRYLRRLDPASTLVLHSVPLDPSLYAIESQRRVALAWSSYVEGDGSVEVNERVAEIERFFGTVTGTGTDDLGLLERYGITHVIERVEIDHLHPHVIEQLRLVTGTPSRRLYEVPDGLR